MKKFSLIALMLAVVMMFTLAACGKDKTNGGEDVDVPGQEDNTDGNAGNNDASNDGDNDADSNNDEDNTDDDATPSDGVSAQDIWDKIAADTSIELPAFMDLSKDDLLSFYNLDAARLDSYVCKYPMMNVTATEIFIAKVASGEMENVKQALTDRQAALKEQWGTYLPAQLELVENYKLVESGDYVIFCIAEKADDIVAIFQDTVG